MYEHCAQECYTCCKLEHVLVEGVEVLTLWSWNLLLLMGEVQPVTN